MKKNMIEMEQRKITSLNSDKEITKCAQNIIFKLNQRINTIDNMSEELATNCAKLAQRVAYTASKIANLKNEKATKLVLNQQSFSEPQTEFSEKKPSSEKTVFESYKTAILESRTKITIAPRVSFHTFNDDTRTENTTNKLNNLPTSKITNTQNEPPKLSKETSLAGNELCTEQLSTDQAVESIAKASIDFQDCPKTIDSPETFVKSEERAGLIAELNRNSIFSELIDSNTDRIVNKTLLFSEEQRIASQKAFPSTSNTPSLPSLLSVNHSLGVDKSSKPTQPKAVPPSDLGKKSIFSSDTDSDDEFAKTFSTTVSVETVPVGSKLKSSKGNENTRKDISSKKIPIEKKNVFDDSDSDSDLFFGASKIKPLAHKSSTYDQTEKGKKVVNELTTNMQNQRKNPARSVLMMSSGSEESLSVVSSVNTSYEGSATQLLKNRPRGPKFRRPPTQKANRD